MHRNGGVRSERQGGEEFFEVRGLDATADDAEEFSIRAGYLPGDHRGPGTGDPAEYRFYQLVRRPRIRLEGFEIGSVRDAHRWDGPCRGGVDQNAIGVEDVDAADIGQRLQLGFEHQVDFPARHPGLVVLRRGDAVRSHEGDQVVLYDLEILELLIEMAGQQQHGVLQLALAVMQRTFAEIAGHHGGADRDRRDQQHAAQDQPADRAAAERGRDFERRGTLRDH